MLDACSVDVGAPTVRRLSREDIGEVTRFVAGLGEMALLQRFDRAMSPAMVAAYYAALDWSTAVVVGRDDGTGMDGVAEMFCWGMGEGATAEVALAAAPGMSGRAAGVVLVEALLAEARRRGVRRVHFVLPARGVSALGMVVAGLGAAEDGCADGVHAVLAL